MLRHAINDAAAQHLVPLIKNHSLSRRCRPHRMVKFHLSAVSIQKRDSGGNHRSRVANFGLAPQRLLRVVREDPVQVFRCEAPFHQLAAHSQRHLVMDSVHRQYKPGRPEAHAKALALAHCVVDHALMPSNHFSMGINKVPRLTGSLSLGDKPSVIVILYKTDFLGIGFGKYREAFLFRIPPHLGLWNFPHRQQQMGKLKLIQTV